MGVTFDGRRDVFAVGRGSPPIGQQTRRLPASRGRSRTTPRPSRAGPPSPRLRRDPTPPAGDNSAVITHLLVVRYGRKFWHTTRFSLFIRKDSRGRSVGDCLTSRQGLPRLGIRRPPPRMLNSTLAFSRGRKTAHCGGWKPFGMNSLLRFNPDMDKLFASRPSSPANGDRS